MSKLIQNIYSPGDLKINKQIKRRRRSETIKYVTKTILITLLYIVSCLVVIFVFWVLIWVGYEIWPKTSLF